MINQAQLDRLCINAIRTLSIDAIQKAHSGHPGTPMGAAPTVYCLWQRFLRYDPEDVNWANRDRFVLSNGHASAMLYSLLYLCGVKAMNPTYEQVGCPAVTLDDIKNFRQAGSRCPGHPEYGWTSGVEATTGPLGQGVAVSVGMAIAERWLAATYNRPGYDLFDYNVYALCGDGCMMEGISSEAASLAGHLKLSNLCWVYDDNHVTIEGPTRITFTEDVAARFLDYGWDPDAQFYVPDGVRAHFEEQLGRRGASLHSAWDDLFAAYRSQYPDLADQIDHMQRGELPEGWDSALPTFPADAKGMATRDSSGKVLNAIAAKVPWLLGGAADLAPSTKTHLGFEFAGEFQAPGPGGDYRGRNFHFGVREHAMCALVNGRQTRCPAAGDRQRSLTLHQGLRATEGGRNQGARDQYAVVGTVRESESGIPRQRDSAGDRSTRGRRRGIHLRLGALYRPSRNRSRYAHIRTVCANEGRGTALRV
jgi:transketolase